MNKIQLIGNIGKDAEAKTFDNGGKIVNFTMATTKRGYTSSDGRKIEDKTTWHNCVVRKKGLSDIAETYLKKGMKVYVEGELDIREYEKDGIKRYIPEVIVDSIELLTPKSDSQSHQEPKDDFPF